MTDDRPRAYNRPRIECPVCSHDKTVIVQKDDPGTKWRRRECQKCQHVFSTYENSAANQVAAFKMVHDMTVKFTDREWRREIVGYRIPHMGKIGDTKHFSKRGN